MKTRVPGKKRDLLYIVLFVSLSIYVLTQVFVKTENVRLLKEIQIKERLVVEAKVQNEGLKKNIQELGAYERVFEIAEKGGLLNRPDSVVNIKREKMVK